MTETLQPDTLVRAGVRLLAPPIVGAGAWAAITWRLRARCVDDALIAVRYAENLIAGHGWVYNPGSHVNAATSPLHVIALVPLLHVLGPEAAAIALGAVGIGAAAIAAAVACGEPGSCERPLMAGAVLLCSMLWASLGMETPWLVLAVIGCAQVLALAVGRPDSIRGGIWLGLAATAAAAVRPDGLLLWPAVIALSWRARKPRVAVAAGAIMLAAGAGFCAWSLMEFGRVVPASAHAKLLHGAIAPQFQVPFVLSAVGRLPAWPLLSALAIVGWWSCLKDLAGHDPSHPKAARALVIVVVGGFAIAQGLSYTALRPAEYDWYHGVFQVAFLLAACRSWRIAAALRLPRRTTLLLAGGLITVAFVCARRVALIEVEHRMASDYRAAGAWLRRSAPPDAVVAAMEIGYLGVHSRLPVLDTVALIHPEALGEMRSDPFWWMTRSPRFVVVHEPLWYSEPGRDRLRTLGCSAGFTTAAARVRGREWGVAVFDCGIGVAK